jgi:hypothetical protein
MGVRRVATMRLLASASDALSEGIAASYYSVSEGVKRGEKKNPRS